MHIFAAGFVDAGQAFLGMCRVCHWHIVVRIDVVMVEIDRESGNYPSRHIRTPHENRRRYSRHAPFPPRGNPLFKFAVTFWVRSVV